MRKTSYKGKTDFFLLFVASVLIVFIIFAIPQYTFLRNSIQSVSCNAIRKNLQKVVEQYKLENGDNVFIPYKEIDTIMLMEKGYTDKKLLVCPDSGVYMLNSQGQVYCTKHNPETEDI
ncbi:MAG: hypothetical protein M0R46_05545 [Candidatus Muirbacterium halophilum]|nr:hypothetical protein [Candidatus Muirbacterium halophilum]MCK9475359.1 hypothetical protein [Candidatus Muirbacterium halophilum]